MIRPAISEDAVLIQQLISQLGYEIGLPDLIDNIREYQQQQTVVLVATDNNNAIGFIAGALIPLFHVKENMLRITALCVDELQRGKGVGKKLVRAIENWCEENGCYYIEVTSGHHRQNEAHLFYQNLGYEVYNGARFQKRLTTTPALQS